MKNSILSLLFLATMITLFSCSKDDTMSDDELIDAIIASEKQDVTETALPTSAITVMNDEYSESFAETAQLAEELGYEVSMMRGMGSMFGERTRIYFNLDGRQLRRNSDRRLDRDGRRRPGNEGCDRNECFNLVFPITVIMPDDSTITGEDWPSLRQDVRSWYAANDTTPYEEHPVLQYPMDIVYEDGTIATINSNAEMRAAFAACE